MARPTGHRLSPDAWGDILECRGLTLTRVSTLADIPRATLSSLALGNSRASEPVARRIAAALNCKPGTLFPTLAPWLVEIAPPAPEVDGETW
jgi:transcriptional regulator with XRE-family HTH domain